MLIVVGLYLSTQSAENHKVPPPPTHIGNKPIVTTVAPGSPEEVEPTEFSKRYHLDVMLGQGSYSVVKLGTRVSDGKKVAVKIVTRRKLSKEDELSIKVESDLLLLLDHPNIVKALDFFEESDHFYLVLEYLEGGELFERLVEKEVYTEAEARDLFSTLLSAVKYCHDRNLIHR